MKYEDEKIFWFAAGIIFSIIASGQFIFGELPLGHDVFFHLLRIEGMSESLSGGQFPVKMQGYFFNDYGYPAGFFYPDLFLYIPAVLRLTGVDLFDAYKIFCVLITLATFFVAFQSFSSLFENRRAGGISALVYTGFLYRLFDMQTRSATGESTALIFMPLALISFWLMLNRSPKFWIGTVIGFTGVLQSHIISSLMMIAAATILFLISLRQIFDRENFFAFAKAAGFTFLLNIWFYFPFVDFYGQYDFHMKNVFTHPESLTDIAVNLDWFIGYRGFCGELFAACILISVGFMFYRNFVKGICGGNDKFFWTLFFVGLFFLAATTKFFVWEEILSVKILADSLAVLQFPFRFMIFTSICWSGCFGIAANEICKRKNFSGIVPAIFCVLIFANNLYDAKADNFSLRQNYANTSVKTFFENCLFDFDNLPENYQKISITDFTAVEKRENAPFNVGIVYADYIYSDIKISNLADRVPPEKLIGCKYIDGSIIGREIFPPNKITPPEFVTNFERHGMTVTFESNCPDATEITLPMFYFPVYRAETSTGEILKLSSGDLHKMKVEVPAGENKIEIKFVGQPAWTISEIVSQVAFVLFLFQIFFREKSLSFA